jgi:hypothetical protein
MIEEQWTLRWPVGVNEGECKRSEYQSSDDVKNAGRERGECGHEGIESEREIPGQVYHRLAGKKSGKAGAAQLVAG